MGKAIKHLMWGYQRHFRIARETRARSLFQLLDERFDPEVFLVGILAEDRNDRYPACVEPEDDLWIPSDAFDGVYEQAKSLASTYPESQLLHSHPLVQQSETERLCRRAVQDTISAVLAEHPMKPAGVRYFPSFPAPRNGYLVTVVLGLQEEVLSSHPRLSIDRAQIHEYRSFKVAVSLIDAAIHEFLEDGRNELVKPDAGAFLGQGKSPAEMMRAAASRLLKDIAYKADPDLDLAGHWEGLFDACAAISSLMYEKAPAMGRIIVAAKAHPALNPKVTFSQPVSVHNARAARKVLELTSQGLALHMNARLIFGLVEVGDYAAQNEDLYEVKVLGYHHWQLSHAGHALMDVHSGQPRLPAPPFNAARLRSNITRVLRALPTEHADLVVSLVEQAAKERHGTMLVVVEDAAVEAKRLAKQATCIQPSPLTPELLRHLTPIDGAVLMSPDGTCHAIGVILDGLATEKGDSARGARFNSAVRYVETLTGPCLAIVVSEDGGVDLVPDLRPTVRRSEIEQTIADLQVILTAPSVNRRQHNKVMEWLQRNRFYLLAEHCAKLNDLVHRIDERLAQDDTGAVRIVRQPFVPDPGFDPDLYYETE